VGRADNLPLSCADCHEIRSLILLETSGPVQVCTEIAFTFTDCKFRTAATIYALETCFVSGV